MARLKRQLLRRVWGETLTKSKGDVKVIIPESVRRIMEERMILKDDVAAVIRHAEKTGSKISPIFSPST